MPGNIVQVESRSKSHSSTRVNCLHLPKFFLILGQLVLLAFTVRQFQIESEAFLMVFILAVAGFSVHYFLPFNYRIHWLLFLSLVSIILVLGPSNGLWIIAIGLLLIVLCHLPIAYSYRVALVLLVAITLALLRSSSLNLPFSNAVWPILGSIFMYRLIVYLYDLKHGRVPTGATHRLAYFFMLPNVCFPLFPVIDSNDFRRLYYCEDRHKIYQTGVVWITRGVIHLLIYRYVYYYLTVAPSDVLDVGDLAQFLIANFLLYLRVSGLFHLVIGLLHLFGFALPETHKLYYLSSSFTDFWRRINIYWKDFMMKVFYYPIYFQLKKYGATLALVASTFLVFILTWLLHSYQWFWLRGTFPIEWQDGAFWGVLAVLVVINSVWEVKAGRKRQLGLVKWHSRRALIKSMKILVIFTAICSLWSLWTCESLEEWLSMWTIVIHSEYTFAGIFLSLIGLLALTVIISVIDSWLNNARQIQIQNEDLANPFASRQVALSLISVLFLSVIGLPQIYTKMGADTANFVLSLRSEKLSRTDTEKLEKGYYEDLIRVDRFNSKLWEVYAKSPVNLLRVQGSGLKEYTDDFLQHQLRASARSVTIHSEITTNKWGMRDQNYTLQPTFGTYRIALLGASSVMGWGVGDEETFDSLLELKLKKSVSNLGVDDVEVLNFGVAGYYPLQQRMVLEKAFGFGVNAIYYIATGREYRRVVYHLQEVIANKGSIPYPYLSEIAAKADVDSSTSKSEALRRLAPYREELLRWLYKEIVENCLERNISPVWVFLPQVNSGRWEETVAQTEAEARSAGFTTINLLEVYADHPIEKIQLTESDFHPNALGHQLVAEHLFEELNKNPEKYFSSATLAGEGTHD